jgi:hypothetical protein
MPKRSSTSRTRLILWVFLGATLAAVTAGLHYRWTLAMPVSGAIGLILWLVKGLYCSVPLLLLGGWIRKRVRPEPGAPLRVLDAATAWAIGCVVVVLAGIAMLAAGVYSDAVWQGSAGVIWLAAVGWFVMKRWKPLLDSVRPLRSLDLRSIRLVSWDSVVLLTGAAALLHAALPPDTRDELGYHLVAPRLWSFQGDWWMATDNFHLLFPGNTEILWGWAWAASGLLAPRFITFVFAVLTVLLLDEWQRDLGIERWIRAVSLIFLIVTPVALTSASICYVEWPLLFFLVVGWRWARISLESRTATSLCWTAACWGLCLGMKYTAALFVGLLALEWIVGLARRRPIRAVAAAAILAVAAGVLAGPWLARNTLATADPVYPLGSLLGIAPAGSHDPATVSEYAEIPAGWRLVPWVFHATVDPVTDHRLHPLWPLLLLLVVLLGWKRRRDLPWFSVVGSTAALAFFTPAPRIYLPLMLLSWLFLPPALKAFATTARDRSIVAASVALAAVVSVPTAFHYMFVAGGPAVPEYLLGAIDGPRYLAQRGLTTPVTRWISAQSPAQSRVWVWCDDRTLYFDRWTRSDSPYGPPEFMSLVDAGGTTALDRRIRHEAIDYIVLNRDHCPADWSGARLEKNQWKTDSAAQAAITGWAASNLEEIQRDTRFTLYRTTR